MNSRQYSWSERDQYDPGPCPHCGGTDARVEWLQVMPGKDRYIPGLMNCLNSKCPSRPQVEDIFR